MIVVYEVAVIHDRPVAFFFNDDAEAEFHAPHKRHPVWWPFLITPFLRNAGVSYDAFVIKSGIVMKGDIVVSDKAVDKFTNHEIDMKSATVSSRVTLNCDLCPGYRTTRYDAPVWCALWDKTCNF